MIVSEIAQILLKPGEEAWFESKLGVKNRSDHWYQDQDLA